MDNEKNKVPSVNEIAKRLKDARNRKGMSQQQAGKLIGVKQSLMSMYETGERTLNLRDALALCKAYDADPNEIFGTGLQSPLPESDDDVTQLVALINTLSQGLDDNEHILIDTFLKLSAYIALRELYMTNPRHERSRLFRMNEQRALRAFEMSLSDVRTKLSEYLSKRPSAAKTVEPQTPAQAAKLRELVAECERIIGIL